ncbi:uncharacterized protein LOC134527111 isoform X3 [Bacillus rossius redtenbacheri]|uniref:uncharacterized protein LOC134527111 isoform X3 n=1 Tax=Bacillus rossius redtenbacheri TaxID=93214 RepID=UPI002FDCC797
MNLLDFSDELLLMVCAYILKYEDKIAVSGTCQRLKNLMSDRTVFRKTSFSKAYYVPFIDVKNFILPGRDYVVELNLTSCCYLDPNDILRLALKLTNLKIFYVADTKFSIHHILALLDENKEITKLSLTWNQRVYLPTESDYLRCSGLGKVESLFIYITPGRVHANVWPLIIACAGLQQLREICQHLSLPHLKEVFIQGKDFLLNTVDWSFLKSCTELTKLCLPLCILKSERDTQAVSSVEETALFKPKRCRVAHVAQSRGTSVFRELVNSSHDLRELDIRSHTIVGNFLPQITASMPSQVEAEAELWNVALLHNLERLVLSDVPIRTGAFFPEVAQSCSRLSSLHLSNLGMYGLCTYSANLVKALPKFKNLKDFRIYQNHLGDIAPIFIALNDCSNLERFAIICLSNSKHKLKKELVEKFALNAVRLTFLFLCVDSLSLGIGEAKTLQNHLDRMNVWRPSLITKIHSYNNTMNAPIRSEEEWTRHVVRNLYYTFGIIPGFHLVEMVFHPCRVSVVPCFWESYNLFD